MAKASARVYQDLRDEILSGAHRAGGWLREEEVAAAQGVSRTPVREALRRLHAEGLVELTPNRGAQVARWEASDVDGVFEIRMLLEGYAARRAAASGRPDLDRLRTICDAMEGRLERLGDVEFVDDDVYQEISELNLEFHGVVHLDANNKTLPGLVNNVIQVALVRYTVLQYPRSQLTRSFRQHRELVEAIAAGDEDWAEAVMRSHCLAARAFLRTVADRQVLGNGVPVETGPK